MLERRWEREEANQLSRGKIQVIRVPQSQQILDSYMYQRKFRYQGVHTYITFDFYFYQYFVDKLSALRAPHY